MANEALLKIQEAESKARDLISDARVQADYIIKNSGEELSREFLQLSEQSRNQACEEKEAAQKKSQLISENFEKQTQELCSVSAKEMLSQKSKAVDLIMELL